MFGDIQPRVMYFRERIYPRVFDRVRTTNGDGLAGGRSPDFSYSGIPGTETLTEFSGRKENLSHGQDKRQA